MCLLRMSALTNGAFQDADGYLKEVSMGSDRISAGTVNEA